MAFPGLLRSNEGW